MSFFTKAVVATEASSYLNAEIQGDEIILKKYYNIGIAVSTDGSCRSGCTGRRRKNFGEVKKLPGGEKARDSN